MVTPGWVRNAWLIPLFPMVGATILLLFGSRMKRAAGAIATTMMVGSLTVGLATFFQVVQRPATSRAFVRTLYSWIPSGRFSINADYRIDPLSLVMILVVTGVGALIHLYSTGYMRGDEREHRYFAYLNLFAFSMLTLVMANNFLVLYVGWEGVGLCSYLLIGFWFDRKVAATAAKKAFITNRVGDVSFAIGIMLIFVTFGTLDFARVFAHAGAIGHGTATAIALLLFGGAVGKSAQIPLFVWLPDAMEGPTPVSALIHAATMVTAGVYMVARTHAIFDLSTAALDVVAWIGAATALYAAIVATAQDDIKRVLAYSTISQLGFMFVAAGVASYPAGIFHLVTHAFFKALLFLSAGSVIHALAGEQSMLRMGGLWRKIPWTAAVMIAGWLAIIAFPGTSGFFSKDEILASAYTDGSTALWLVLLAATLGTGFYMSRLIFLTFFGSSRVPHDVHPHEAPPSMVFPLVLLAGASLVGGIMGAGGNDEGRLQNFLKPALTATAASGEARSLPEKGLGEFALGTIAFGASAAGAAVAGYMYLGGFAWERRRERANSLRTAAARGFYVDDAYQFLFTGVGKVGAAALAVFDTRIVDGAVNWIGTGINGLAAVGRRMQTGLLRSYGVGVLAGMILLFGLLLVRVR
jgi:NADH-quinone oxidoreductase subunit L